MTTATPTALLALALLIALLPGCEGAPRDDARRDPTTTPALGASPPAELGAEASTVYARALTRDPEPSCAALTAGLRRPTEALLEVVERTTAPPSAGMRAATCLVREHASEVEPQLTRWVQRRATMGLGLLVLDHLDRLEPALAERVARAALAGEYAERARPRIGRSERSAHLLGTPAERRSVR